MKQQPEEKAFPASIELYLSYNYLPLKQQAKILEAISGVYEAVIEAVIEANFNNHNYHFLSHSHHLNFYPPLCINSAQTGESIRLKFDAETKLLPGLEFNDGYLDILVPYWSAAVIITAALLSSGISGYKNLLEIKKLNLEIKKLNLEIKKLNLEIEQIDIESIEKIPARNKIAIHLNQFYFEINQSNINNVEINGSPINSKYDN